jgi:hypothetical protein
LTDSTQNSLILKDDLYRFDSKFLLNQDFSVQIELRSELNDNNNNMTYFDTNFENIFMTREQSIISSQVKIENLNDKIKLISNKFTQMVLNQVQICEDKYSLFTGMNSGDFIDFEFENQSVLFSAENGNLIRVDCDKIDTISFESQLNECYEDIPVFVNATERVFLSNNNILLESSEALSDCDMIQRKIAIKGTRLIFEQTSDQLRVSQSDESSHMIQNLGSTNYNKLIPSKNLTNLKAMNSDNIQNNYTYIKEKSIVQGKEEERTLYTIMIILFVFVNTCLIAYLIYMVCCILKRKSFSNTKSIAMEFCLNRNRRRKSGKNAVNMDKEETDSTTDSNRKLELKQEISNEVLSEN